jgi:radical SAM superfamily enzyme YgiQ (UPF0313 family)
MRILLIKPKWLLEGNVYKYWDLHGTPPLGLGIIAALSEGHEVKILDEDMEEIVYSPEWDLVGVTAVTFTSPQAYAISGRFREQGVKTVLGGVHPSLMPEESIRHADAVVVGEAEPVWKRLLHDAEKNGLQKVYYGNRIEDLDEVPFPRRDLFHKKYFTAPLQITRGCTNQCRYCYLQSVPWGKWRKREDLDRVREEMRRIPNRSISIVDDNLFVDHDYAKSVFDAIAPLKKDWGIQLPPAVASDDVVMEKAVRAGLYGVVVGLQAARQKSLDSASIRQRVEGYKDVVRRLRKWGILIGAFFMFGFDTDDTRTFSRTVELIKELDVDDVICHIITPLPGTGLFKEYEAQGRILTRDWSKYGGWHSVFRPALMSAEELEEGFCRVYEELNVYYRRTFLRRAWRYRKGIPGNLPLAGAIARDYLTRQVDIAKLP